MAQAAGVSRRSVMNYAVMCCLTICCEEVSEFCFAIQVTGSNNLQCIVLVYCVSTVINTIDLAITFYNVLLW